MDNRDVLSFNSRIRSFAAKTIRLEQQTFQAWDVTSGNALELGSAPKGGETKVQIVSELSFKKTLALGWPFLSSNVRAG